VKYLALALGFIFFSNASTVDAKRIASVKVLTWWDYIDDRVLQKTKNGGFNLDISIYKSNEVAISRLAAGYQKYDIAIISNFAIAALSSKVEFEKYKEVKITKNKILPFILGNSLCKPYLWSTTVFSYDSNNVRVPPENFDHLRKLKNSGILIGIIDDSLEYIARVTLEHLKENSSGKINLNYLFSQFFKLSQTAQLEKSRQFEKVDFKSTIEPIIKNQRSVAYGWHGESASQLNNAPWIDFSVPDSGVIIGSDYVCIPKWRTSTSPKLSELERLRELLTDAESTRWNVESTQYFSPYFNDTKGLKPKVEKLYRQVVAKVKNNHAVMISMPGKDHFSKINNLWKQIRYENIEH